MNIPNMTNQTKKLVILFADISDSTALYDNLGDERALQLVVHCLTSMSERAAPHGGILVKTIGDEIMCAFPTAEAALEAAKEMQRVIKKNNTGSEHSLHVRIGFHIGEVMCEEADMYGETVNVAARVTAITRADQIMTTRDVVDALPPPLRNELRQILRADFRDKQGQLDIFQVACDDEMQRTRVGLSAYRTTPDGAQLILSYRGQSCRVNTLVNKVFLGRGGDCKIVVVNDYASRQHAAVAFRSGNFIFQDNSINGTYIRFNDGQIVFIRNEEAILRGFGTISLGRAYSDNPSELIAFSIRSTSEFEILP